VEPNLGLGGSLEGSLTGAQSPANPWHQEDWNGTRWLDDSTLEKKIVLGGGASYRLKAFMLSCSAKIGWVQNQLALADVVNTDASNGDGSAEPIWEPSGYSGLIGELTLGVRYSFKP